MAKETDAILHVLHVARVPAPDMDVPLPFGANPRWEREGRLRLEQLIRQNPSMLRVILELHHIVVPIRTSHQVRLCAPAHSPYLLDSSQHPALSYRHLLLSASPPAPPTHLFPFPGLLLSLFQTSLLLLPLHSSTPQQKKAPRNIRGAWRKTVSGSSGGVSYLISLPFSSASPWLSWPFSWPLFSQASWPSWHAF